MRLDSDSDRDRLFLWGERERDGEREIRLSSDGVTEREGWVVVLLVIDSFVVR